MTFKRVNEGVVWSVFDETGSLVTVFWSLDDAQSLVNEHKDWFATGSDVFRDTPSRWERLRGLLRL